MAGRERMKATAWGLFVSGLLMGLIVIGSRNLQHFDAALIGYTFATLFATFGITYRYAMWLHRPPTRLYWRRGWQVFAHPRHVGRNLLELLRRQAAVEALDVQQQAMRVDGVDMRRPADEGDVMSGAQQQPAIVAPDRSGPDHRDLHDCFLCSADVVRSS